VVGVGLLPGLDEAFAEDINSPFARVEKQVVGMFDDGGGGNKLTGFGVEDRQARGDAAAHEKAVMGFVERHGEICSAAGDRPVGQDRALGQVGDFDLLVIGNVHEDARLTAPPSFGAAITISAQQSPVAGNLGVQFTVVTLGNFQNAFQNVPYNGSVDCQNGTKPCTFAISSGSLPTGITHASGAAVFVSAAGPSGSGLSSFCIVATDSVSPAHVSSPFCTGITVNTLVAPFIIVTPTGQTIPSGTTGFQMNAQGVWTNSCPPSGTVACPNINTLVTWAPVTFGTGGTLGLHTGILAAGSAALTVNVTAAFNAQTSVADPVIITSSTPVISTGSLPNGQINQVYPKNGSPAGSNQLICGGGTGPWTFANPGGGQPTGFPVLPSSGLVGGTATAAGTFTPAFNCTATGGGGTSANKTLNIVIESLSSIAALAPAAPTVAQFGTRQFTATCNYSGPSSAPCQPASGVGTIAAAGCGANANNSTNVATLATATPCSVNVGDLYVIGYGSDNATTPAYTVPTDTAGNTAVAATAQQCAGGASDRCNRMYYMPITTASAADTITAHFGTATFPVSVTVTKLIGAAASPFDQNGNSNDGGTAGTQGTSASITPTVANTMAVFMMGANGGGRTFTAGTGCTVQVTDPAGFMSMESCPIAGTSATTELMTFNGAAAGWNGAISNYKPAPGGSGLMFSATDASGLNVASIDPNSGIATALNPGTSNIKACVGATCSANDLMTVTAAADTSVTTACPSSVNVGSSGQCTATGHPSGTVYVSGVTWSTSNAAVLTVNSSGVIQGIANGTATITAQLASGVSGTSGTVTVSTQGTGALLTGAVVTSDNVNRALSTITPSAMSAATAAGWTLYWARGFENGTGNSAIEQNNNTNGGGVNTTQFHSGSHSFGGLYTGNGGDPSSTDVDYGICGSVHAGGSPCAASAGMGSFSEIYISYWEYVDPNALFASSDYFWGGIAVQGVCGQLQDVQLDAQFGKPNSSLTANMVVVADGTDYSGGSGGWPQCMGYYQYANQAPMTMNQGAWQQIEMDIFPSTTVSSPFSCTQINNSGSDCVGNGHIDVWLNGNRIIHIVNADLNGTQSMAGADVGIGGTLTDFSQCVWTSGPTAPPCTGTRPGGLPPSPFNRYFDDIIVFKK
jgi:Bacterial Ig-like domain (group 2)